MKYFFSALITVGIIFLLFNCKTNTKLAKSGTNFKVIASGNYGGISVSSHKIVSDKTEYDQLFSELYKNQFPDHFPSYSSGKSYIFFTFGKKSDGGLDYEVATVENTKNSVKDILKSLYENTGKPMVTTSAISCPYLVIEINKTNIKLLELVKEENEKDIFG